MGEGSVPSDKSSFRQFYLDEYANLLKHLLAMGARWHEAEDAVEEAMAQLFKRWNLVRMPRAWVRTAARHLYFNSRRYWLGSEVISRVVGGDQDPTAPDPAIEAEELETVRRMLALLPPAQREVITYTMEGYKPTEIAEIIGKSPETVRSNLRMARKQLRERLSRQRSPLDADSHDRNGNAEGEEQE